MEQLSNVATRSYKSYRARLMASLRLQARGRAWNTSLLSLAVATTFSSIALLTDDGMYGKAGPTVLVCVSVLALVASLVVTSLNYGGRSRDMFMNYRALQRLSVEAENLLANSVQSPDLVDRLSDRYESLLDDSENHTSADHKRADPGSDVSIWVLRRAHLLTALPYVALIIPLAVLAPIVSWFFSGAGS
ncbi:SLATT domain-containing protein [Subtercola boreus]|uniref:SLATT domain-containing protein n=1 Tax=Subtercola boreus TaxID=120213 RepID=UPI000E2EC71F